MIAKHYVESTLLTSVNHTLVQFRGSFVVFSEHSESAIFFLLLFERAGQSYGFCFLHSTKSSRNLCGLFCFGNYKYDFIIIFAAESLFASSAAVMESVTKASSECKISKTYLRGTDQRS